MSDVFSQRNLPDRAEGWGREVEDRIKALETGVSRAASVAKGAQVVSVKSAEAADENIRQVAESVAVLDDAVSQRIQDTLDLAVAELRESEKVLEAQFEVHDISLAEAETAIGSLELATEPGTMAAAVGVFIDAMMENLTVTGVAAITQATVDNLYARMAVVEKLQATQGIITKDMIATGAVTSDKVAANAVSAAMVDVGQNAKWDSTGLRFFTPVAQGQQWDDWNSRQPLIELTPGGSSAVRVSDGTSVTAGLDPSGQVWGETGDFGNLKVAGRDFLEYVEDRPLGTLGITRVKNNLSINNTENHFAGIRANLYHGRSYMIQRWFGVSRSSGKVQFRTYLKWGANNVRIAQQDQVLDGDFTTPVVFQPQEFGVPNGQEVLVMQSIYTATSGATGTLWADMTHKAGGSQMALFDMGPSVTIWEQTVSAPVNPVVTRTGAFGTPGGQPLRPDGSYAPDGRLTTAGYSVYGSDMSEYVYFPIGNIHLLNGSTVNSAVAEIQVSYSANNSAGTQYFIGVRKNGVDTNIASGTAYAGQVNSITFPAGYRQLLVGAQGMFVKPYQSGSYNSYGNWTGHFRVTVNYSK